MRKILILTLFYNFLFSQEIFLKQTAISSAGVNASAQSATLMGTLGQSFVGRAEAENTILSAGIWGSIALVTLGIDEPLPTEFAISNAYPNPFNPTVNIDFSIPEQTKVNIRIYDLLGRLVFVHKQEFASSGKYRFRWDGSKNNGIAVASGIYFVAIQHEAKIYNQKITYLK